MNFQVVILHIILLYFLVASPVLLQVEGIFTSFVISLYSTFRQLGRSLHHSCKVNNQLTRYSATLEPLQLQLPFTLAPGRCQTLYFYFTICKVLCFWFTVASFSFLLFPKFQSLLPSSLKWILTSPFGFLCRSWNGSSFFLSFSLSFSHRYSLRVRYFTFIPFLFINYPFPSGQFPFCYSCQHSIFNFLLILPLPFLEWLGHLLRPLHLSLFI